MDLIMIRALGFLTMGGSFLAISPQLREDLFFQAHKLTGKLNDYSPYSYIALALCLFGLITMSLYRSTGLRS
ncbi:MAG: hypothetical protein ACLPY2_13765 [Bryobacteraceae bacterium]|jgi:hypothetical protein